MAAPFPVKNSLCNNLIIFYCYAGCRIFVAILNVIMLSVVVLNVFLPSAILLNALAPFCCYLALISSFRHFKKPKKRKISLEFISLAIMQA
jgi:hypothetical protein